mmetsp:Transcript_14422/g.39403  ORF Transcript_14422/g.39403 Transcript_14422/m.39403 type:complete len:129 (-) Transcript_14422:299-685(-)
MMGLDVAMCPSDVTALAHADEAAPCPHRPIQKDRCLKPSNPGPSARAGLVFPVGSIKRALREAECRRFECTSAVYVTAVVEYLVAEILELAGNEALDSKRLTIKPKHVRRAIEEDEELNEFVNRSIFV